ncbi:MAG TPA: PbrT family lead (Pb2+) uptake porter, partial [Protaetiibacter sp.]|nr:PbrT family lead (Pb2+) uptake porter [Protaetiibacter sp.]
MPAPSSARTPVTASTGSRAAAPAFATLALAALALAGCVPNAPGGTALTVDITDSGCAVSANTAVAGAVSFTLTNNGTDVNEFEILAED